MRSKVLKNKYVQRGLWFLLFIIVWESIYRLNLYAVQIFPSVGQIFDAFISGLTEGSLIKQVGYSCVIIFRGLFIGILLALLLSFLSYISKVFESLLDSIIAVLHPLPGVALLPLVILIFGVGEKAIVVIIIHSILWPMTINIKTGFKNINRVFIEIAQNNGINFIQLFFYVLMPLSMPYIISGLKIGWSRSWRALISSEMIFGAIGSLGGIGWYLFEKRVFMDTPGMYAGLFVIILIGMLVEDIVFSKLEKYSDKMRL